MFRKDIQGLRAIAFLLVFIFHLNAQWLPGGFLGVDLFFVISGYLITGILVKEVEQNQLSFIDFYKKRIFRIVPAYLFMLLFVVICGAFVYMYTDIRALKYYLKNSLFFISNTVFAQGESYFGAKLSENPLLHTWSLAIEMQFYLIFPFVIQFFRKYLVRVFLVIIFLLLGYSSYNIFFKSMPGAMYFSLLARIPEFLIGGLFALWFKNGIDYGKLKNSIIGLSSFVLLLICSFFITEKSPFPGVLVIIPCVASALLLVTKNHLLTPFLSSKPMEKIGEYSYSLYLWHWPVMAFIRYKYETYEFSYFQILIVVLFTLLMSWLSYRFVESVFRKKNLKFSFSIIAAKTLVVGGLIYYLPLITAKNFIPDVYSKPIVGKPSHYDGKIEKFGDLSKNSSFVLIGDSNALMLKPFFDKLGKNNGFSFETLTCDAFPALEGVLERDADISQKNMYDWSRSLVGKTKSMVNHSQLILLCATGYDHMPSVVSAVDHFASSLGENQKLVLISGFPTLDKNPLRINNYFVKQSNYEFTLKPRLENEQIIRRIMKGKDNVYFYDIAKSKIFNTAPYVNDTIAYYDSGHLNTYGSEKLAIDLEKDFMSFYKKLK